MENDFVKILEDFVEKSKTNEKPISEEFESDNEIIEEELDETYDNDYETQLQEMESEYNNLKEKYIRQVAEFDNFRKRTLKEKEELRQNGHQKAVETLFPIIDDFERALNNISDEAKEGVQLIYNKFISRRRPRCATGMSSRAPRSAQTRGRAGRSIFCCFRCRAANSSGKSSP
jgi:molecular chaperone GrpE (heat shock protein)